MTDASQTPYKPQAGDLERKLRSQFPNDGLREAARSQLLRYGHQAWHREVDRVRMAILKLAGSDLLAIDKWVDQAGVDFRDVLAAAESPAYMALKPGIDPSSPAAQAAIASDRKQYTDWIAES